jgi:signal transduction histidine kinase
MLDRSLELTRNGLNEARRAIQALRVAPLDDLGLNLALRNLAISEAERGGYQLELDLPEEMPRLQPEAEHGVYRIAEEALRNIAWHADAKIVKVKMGFDDGRLEMEIRDDGCGFIDDPQLQAEHFGIRGMRERAEGLGGKLVINSQADRGTEVHLEMGVKHGKGLNL